MKKNIEIVNAPSTDGIVVKGEENDLKAIKEIFSQKPHLFVKCGEIKEGQMTISFPSVNREPVEIFLNDYINQ